MLCFVVVATFDDDLVFHFAALRNFEEFLLSRVGTGTPKFVLFWLPF
jgi:hypothetical protein